MTLIRQLTGALLLLFMIGSLFGLGLDLALGSAVRALRNVRFVVLALVWGFVIGPAFAWLLVRVFPIPAPYATGLILLGVAPVAPFAPMMVERARGDLAYVAALMLLAAAGALVFMPLAVPVMAAGLSADPWTIATPLLFYVLAPLVAGVALRAGMPAVASRARPPVRLLTNGATALMLLGMLILYGRAILGTAGSGAVALQVLFLAGMTAAAYLLGFGLPQAQRSVLGIGMCTRNVGAALAPLVAIPGTDPRAIVMCVIAAVLTPVLALIAAVWFGRGARNIAEISSDRHEAPGANPAAGSAARALE